MASEDEVSLKWRVRHGQEQRLAGHAERLLAIIDFAFASHAGQVDKAGLPYIYHAMRVGFSLLPDVEACVAGVLHDICEDCPEVDAIEIRMVIGKVFESSASRAAIWKALVLLCHDELTPYQVYIRGLIGNELAVKVKLADLTDNLAIDRLLSASAAGHDVARMVRKYSRAMITLRASQFN